MHPSRIFDKPIGFHAGGPPPLQVVGLLPSYEEGVAYEGRLSILNAIGDCTTELLDGTSLPPGATATVDNATKEVVIRWPPYSPPATEKPGIINWNFEEGDLTGWTDLRGGSWDVYVYDRGTPGAKDIPYLPADGNRAARMEGVGRGEHPLESIRYPAVPGEPVMARSLWYQGPSNKDNNNLWTAIVFYGPGGRELEVRGDRIHDRTNKRRHYSTANAITPSWANEKSVRLIAHRRNSRNRLINVDDVQTQGFTYATGVPDDAVDYRVSLKVTDSANRIAYWSGEVYGDAVFYTSLLYPVESYDYILGAGAIARVETGQPPADDVLGRGELLSVVIQNTVEYRTLDAPTESVLGSGELLSVIREETMRYLAYADRDSIQGRGELLGLSLEVTHTYKTIPYDTESIQGRGELLGVTLT